MLVKEYMRTDVPTVAPEMNVLAAAKLMREKKVRHLPIVRDGKLLAIVADGDLRAAWPSPATLLAQYEISALLERITLAEVARYQVLTTAPTAALEEAGSIFVRHGIGALPVVEGERVVGLLTRTDVLRALLVAGRAQAARVAA